MEKRIVGICYLFLFFILVTGCTTYRPSVQKNPLDSLDVSSYAQNVYVGLSGPYSTEKEMVEQAIVNCAKNILIADAIALDSRVVSQWGTGKNKQFFASDDHAYYDDAQLANTIGRLVLISVTYDQEAGAIVVARDPEKKGGKRPYQSSYGDDGKPTWLKTYPEVGGYLFGVGSSRPYYFLNDSLEAADFSAAQNLLDLQSDYTFSKSVVDVHNEDLDRTLYQNSRALLQGFSIVSRYYDKETDTYWSLASIQL
ncbi:hypothetical protein SpiGrapes_0847 [Sphaerochaeta pleomorpha str. Grapes]|uniref:Lipoprotein n=1 Tax=Sphaerochaeta pleomorpha (strain ATCC BAA-1885 / DSM 22778 / Grapes) TaxID=158190 RepID=G8QQP3_SPHPG|nr:hypothetical protein [Sphaerochaeta pleomorpha]AEV28674.1 hypothetical protein SpiGrapes_0847 [Sphaerochaeta pleomorpha str. Grapes]